MQEWEPIRTQIESVSAGIILNTGTETLERRIAAKDDRDPEDLTPELTLGEAIEIAFATTKRNGYVYYGNMPLHESLVKLIVDQPTANEIQSQLNRMPQQERKFYNVKIRRGMNIKIRRGKFFKDSQGEPIMYGQPYYMKGYYDLFYSEQPMDYMKVRFEKKSPTSPHDTVPWLLPNDIVGITVVRDGIADSILVCSRDSLDNQAIVSFQGNSSIGGDGVKWTLVVPSTDVDSNFTGHNHFTLKNVRENVFLKRHQ